MGAKRKEGKKREFLVYARVTLAGAYVVVEADSEEDARAAVEGNPFFYLDCTETVDWEITAVKGN